MKPDRSNYEIWLIDWLDGKLGQPETDMLLRFLDENPDLKEETELLTKAQIPVMPGEFDRKDLLKRNASQLPESQIEYLSVAYLENDITSEQKEDLDEYLRTNPSGRKIFDTIIKTRLKPDPEIRFKGKTALLKGTGRPEVIRMPSFWLSAAAVIALLIIGTFMFTGEKEEKEIFAAENTNQKQTEPVLNTTTSAIPVINPVKPAEPKSPEKKRMTDINADALPSPAEPVTEILTAEPTRILADIPSKVTVSLPSVTGPVGMNNLMLASNRLKYPEYVDDGRSNVEKFIARNFREVLLREEIPADTKLKSYEIAEAGIDGLNKLLGWEMTLVKNNDEEGDVKSVSFNSKLLKFNSPVKNEESVVTF